MGHTNRLWALLFCTFVAVLVAAPNVGGLRAQDQQPPTTAPAGEVEFIVESPPAHYKKSVTFEPIDTSQDLKAVREYMVLVRRELKRNPELIERTGLKYFIIVKNLRVSGQERGLTPDVHTRAIYATGRGAHNRVYQRHCVHHEFFHYLMGQWKKDMYFKDPEWIAFNPPGTRYGSGGVAARGPDQYTLTHPAPGFINRYSQSAVEEDMCEIFAALQVPEERRLLMQWAREDEALRNKMKYMREELIPRYLKEMAEASEKAEATSRPAQTIGEGEEAGESDSEQIGEGDGGTPS